MKNIHPKVLLDLEFDTVLQHISDLCYTELGKKYALRIKPFQEKEDLIFALAQTNEYTSSFENQNTIPSHTCEKINTEIKLLQIEGNALEVGSIKKIHQVLKTVNEHIVFFQKFKELYPILYQTTQSIECNTEPIEAIEKIIDKYGEIKNEASQKLTNIRKEINILRTKINESFRQALAEYNTSEYLDDIRETVIDNRRVLAIKAMYRRKVNGTVLGSSKTGSIVYIEPKQTELYSRELNNLLYDEKEEIVRILKELTYFLSFFVPLLKDYQSYIIAIDLICAKARYARMMNGLLPEITEEHILELHQAYHPLLLLTNLKNNQSTYPQSFRLDEQSRIIVISGPNAGGKSITLKTIGLLQLMLQSGMLIPVHHRSRLCLFDRILTDIGDNQSIENHLSTYSYRLKNMNYFLKKCNQHTLFLIDEFGTGSDPELGGALAETFLEEFYHRKAFGVITTHYANLKILANELPHMNNANMLFNNQTLEPVYKLIIGEAGSSFTFEVAQKNGIPYSLINRAKKKIESGKIRFDATIAKLQKERSRMEKTSEALKEEKIKARNEARRLEELNQKIKSKLVNYQELYDHNQRMIYIGNKINDLAERYFKDNKKRPLISEFLRIVETENSKRKPLTKEQENKQKEIKKQTEQELSSKIEKIRIQRKAEKKAKHEKALEEKKQMQKALKVNDRVRLKDGHSVGTIDKIEKQKATVNYGTFTTTVNIDQLELVQSAKM